MDGYSAHMEPPKCEFIATWTPTGDYSKPYLPQVELHLEGAKSPRNFCKIDFSGTADVAKGDSLQKGKFSHYKCTALLLCAVQTSHLLVQNT